MNNIIIERRHIDKAKEILSNRHDWPGTALFEFMAFEEQDWFYDRFTDEDHHPYVDAVLAFAQCEMYGGGGLFNPNYEELQAANVLTPSRAID